MQRILDLDLDFFVHGAVHWAGRGDDRPEADYVKPWGVEQALGFLEDRCGLSGRLPGWVVEHHGQMFPLWRTAIERGDLEIPFHVTHVDAHADLGLGDAGYVQIVTDLLHRPVEERTYPNEGSYGIGDGNWLAFAVACRWISAMEYVHHDEGGNDILQLHMKDYDVDSDIQMKAVDPEEWERVKYSFGLLPASATLEPEVPYRQVQWGDFRTDEPYDFICLAQSPPFTPPESDELFDLICERFIDHTLL